MFDSKKVWKGIRLVVKLKSRSGSTPTKLLVKDVEISYPNSMADAFNNFFSNIGNNLTKNVFLVYKNLLCSISQFHLKTVSFYFPHQKLKM